MTSLWKLRIRLQCERFSKLECRCFQYRNVNVCEQRWRLWSMISVGSEVIGKFMMTAHYKRNSPSFSHYILITCD